MLKKWNRFLAFALAFVLVVTTFGSDFASAKAYALGDETEIEQQTTTAEDNGGTWSEIIEQTNEEGTPADSATVADTEETQPAADAQVVDGSTEEVQDPDQPPVDETDLDDESGDDEPDEDADAATDEDETPAEEIKEKLVTVTYKAGKGGKVSFTKETINVNNPEEAFAGSTATANEHYQFFAWVDEDEKPVCTESTFVPSDVTEDATFTATFVADENIEELMPLLEVKDKKVGDFIVSVEAEVGVFPAGTTVEINQIADSLAEKMAQDALGGESEKQAKGVDITFKDADGIEIQPNDNRFVHVSLKLDQTETVEGESFTVLHEHEGEVKEIKASVSTEDANNDPSDATKAATEVTFDANQFSIFIVVGEHGDDEQANEREVVNMNFYNKAKNKATEENKFFSKLVKKGDFVANVGIPTIPANSEFVGWYIDGVQDSDHKVTFTMPTEAADIEKYPEGRYEVGQVTTGVDINVYPVFSTTYYITFIGTDGEIWKVDQVTENDLDSQGNYSFKDKEHELTAGAGKGFKGWAKTSTATEAYWTIDDASWKIKPETAAEEAGDKGIFLYAVTAPAYWIRFEGNGSGASFTGPQTLFRGETLQKALDKAQAELRSEGYADGKPTRNGYEFKGWSLESGENNPEVTRELKNTKIEDIEQAQANKELKLYAIWAAKQNASFTVNVWYQKVEGGNDYSKDYDFAYSQEIKDVTTNADITTSFSGNTISVKVGSGYNNTKWSTNNVSTNDIKGITNKKTNSTDKGFEYNESRGSKCEIKDGKGNPATKVSPAGDTVVNVYVQRREITITLKVIEDYSYYNGNSDDGNVYGKSRGTYFHIYKANNGLWYDYDAEYTYDYYTGYRYKANWKDYDTYKGLYGQTLKSKGYEWSASYIWNDKLSGLGTTQSLKDRFDDDITYYGWTKGSVKHNIYHYKQNIDGSYTFGPENEYHVTFDSDQNFGFEDKFTGFTVYKYYAGTNRTNKPVDGTGSDWRTCGSESVPLNNQNKNIYIVHKRKAYSLTEHITYPDTNTEETSISGILFEQVLRTNANVATIAKDGYAPRAIAGYSFGWYKDPAGTQKFDFGVTMPDGGIVVYGIYKPDEYKVTLHPDGGSYVGQIRDGITAGKINVDSEGNATFNVPSTELVNRNNLITGVEKTGFELIEWFTDANTKFDYSKRLTKDIHLYAHWRYQGAVKLIYQTDAAKGSFGSGATEFSPEYYYGTNTSAVAAAPPTSKDGYSFVGWEVVGLEGERYLPNDAFKITTEVINANNEKETIGGIDYRIVRVNAVYSETGGEGGEKEKTSVTFLANGGTLIPGSDTTGFTAIDGGYKKENIYVNEQFAPLGKIYSKKGYVMTNWNTLPDNNGYSVPLSGKEIAADKINRTNPTNPASNILYAIYQPIQIKVVVSGSDAGQKTYNGQEQSNKVFSVKEIICTDVDGNPVSNDGISITVDDITYSGEAAKGTNVGQYSKGLVAGLFSYIGAEWDADNVSFEIDAANPSFKIEITKATLTVKTSSAEKEYDGTPLTSKTATITGFVSGESATVEAKGTITNVGKADNIYDESSIVWKTNTNKNNYTITDELGTLEVKVRTTAVTITAPSASKTYDGTALTADGSDPENPITWTGLPKYFKIVGTASGSQTDAGKSANTVDIGYEIKDANNKTVSKDFFKTITLAPGTLTVSKAKYTVKTESAAKPYDGTALTQAAGAEIKGIVEGETATVVPDGTITEPGSVLNTYTISWGTAKESNYELADNGENLGTLTVSKAQITLRADSAEKYYDGEPLTSNKIHIAGQGETLPAGYTIGGICTGEITDAGSTTNEVSSWWIKDAQGNEKTTFYELKVAPIAGTLTVKAIPVTISTGEGTKTYDGTALTNSSVTKTINVEAAINEKTQAKVNKLVVTAKGSQTEVGHSNNNYEIDWKASGEKSSNYAITDALGVLEVTPYTSTVTITAATQNKTYDGQPLVNHTVTADGLPTGFTVSGTTTGSITNYDENPEEGVNNNLVVTEGEGAYKILDAQGKTVDKKNFTTIVVVDGRLTIDKASLTITSADAEKEYDGTPLTNSSVTKTGFVNGEGEKVQVRATGTITEVGNKPNTIEIVWGNVKESNYDLTKTPGTLTITAQTAEVQIIAPSDDKEYDGTPLTCDGSSEDEDKQVKATGLPEGFYVVGTATGSITNVGTAANVVNADYVIKDANDNEVNKAFFATKTLVNGTLEVTKAPLTIHTEGASKEYDGTPLTKTDGVDVIGLKNNETVTVTPKGTITEIGTTANDYDIEWGTTSEDNYDVTDDLGTLEITGNTDAITITAASGEKTYDGTPLENHAVTAEGLPEGFTLVATTTDDS
nr:InlB B-repeat-containing protein [Butyrivibrio sp.]